MKIKQCVIVISTNRYGKLYNYDSLVKALNDGWIVKRMDYLYTDNGKISDNAYILEKEFKDDAKQNA